jgi:DNA-binding IscR family transcriptional regulator
LVHEGILKGVRGPRGGYELGRDQGEITADEILRAAGTVDDGLEGQPQGSPLVAAVVMPALAQAERAFSSTLGAINLGDLMQRAEKAKLG